MLRKYFKKEQHNIIAHKIDKLSKATQSLKEDVLLE